MEYHVAVSLQERPLPRKALAHMRFLLILAALTLTAVACTSAGDHAGESRLASVCDRGKVVCATLDDTPASGF